MDDAGEIAIAQEVIQPATPETVAETPEVKVETKEEPKQEPKRETGYQRVKNKVNQLQAELAQLKAQQPKEAPTEPKKPDWNEYAAAGKTSEQYFEDLADYKADQKIQNALKQREEKQQQERWQSERESQVQNYRKQTQEFAKTTPDFYEVTGAVDFDMQPSLQQAILESDKAAELTYYLAKNPELADSLNEMPYGKVARELGKIEARLETPKVEVKTTKAPPPINPVGSKAKGTVDPYSKSLDPDDWRSMREQGII